MDSSVIEECSNHLGESEERGGELMNLEVGKLFSDTVVELVPFSEPRSQDHFMVDGTLIDARSKP